MVYYVYCLAKDKPLKEINDVVTCPIYNGDIKIDRCRKCPFFFKYSPLISTTIEHFNRVKLMLIPKIVIKLMESLPHKVEYE